jgi:hypothetical protein
MAFTTPSTFRPLLMRPLLPEHRLLWVGFVGFGLKTGVTCV